MYFFYLIKKRKIFKALYFYLKISFNILNYRYLKIKNLFVPKKIKSLIIKINSDNFRKKKPTHNQNIEIRNIELDSPKYIYITANSIKLDSSLKWNQKFYDDEITLSLHRWNWLLRSITDEKKPGSHQWGVNIIRSYLKSMSAFPNGIASESYTVGERISNLYLFNFYHKGQLPRDLVNSITDMSYKLINNIEYYETYSTGNHVINNARAIIFAGYLLKEKNYLQLGASLIKHMLPKLIDEEGFLREGSSHYQFLFTRWLLELEIISHFEKDTELNQFLNPHTNKLLQACNFFLIDNYANGFPLIGDISPDCDPLWLSNLPLLIHNNNENNFKKWNSLFYEHLNYLYEKKTTTYLKDSYKKNKNWSRLEFKNLVSIIRHEAFINDHHATHAHDDYGSFVLFYKGKEIIIDPGRLNYQKRARNCKYVDAEYHSTVTLNGMSATNLKNEILFIPEYLNIKQEINYVSSENCEKIEIKQNGFTKYNKNEIIHKRTICLYEKEIHIKDKFIGSDNVELKKSFHIPKELKFMKFINNKNIMTFCHDELNVDIQFINKSLDEKQKLKNAKRALEYSKEVDSQSLEYKKMIRLPYSSEVIIKILD